MSEQLTLIERSLRQMPVGAAKRLARFTGALLANTSVVVGMEVNGEAAPPLAGYAMSGDETRRDLVLPHGHAPRWMTVFWRYLSEDKSGGLYDADGIIDYIAGARDAITYRQRPAPRMYGPAHPGRLEPGHTYELRRDRFGIHPVYGVDQSHLCLTTPGAAQPLMVIPVLPLAAHLKANRFVEFTPVPLSQ